MSVKVRIAPAPSGDLHIGNVRTALFNYFFATKNNGKFVLRIDDTDKERSEFGWKNIVDLFGWLGINFDEGPHKLGNQVSYEQSKRGNIYSEQLEILVKKGAVYDCFCSKEDLSKSRDVKETEPDKIKKYGRTCLNLSAEKKEELLKTGTRSSIRFKIPEGNTTFNDLLCGNKTKNNDELSDLILRRSDGSFTYPFATVVDDALFGITHIIRGKDLLENTPFQVLLYNALDFKLPVFAHIPLVLDEKGAKLSKRDKHASVNFYREEGYLPEALINYMALIGWNPGRKSEVLTREEIIAAFDITKVIDSNARFDMAKLNYLNKAHMRRIDPSRYIELAKPYIEKAGLQLPSTQVALLSRESTNLLKDAPSAILPYVSDTFPIGQECNEYIAKENVHMLCLEIIKSCKSGVAVKEAIDSAGKKFNVTGKDLHFPIRALLIGSTSGPPIERIANAIGMEKFYQRLKIN